jgi:hypothetical protein
MPVSASDIIHYQSAVAGSAGGAISASSIASGVPNNVWPDITDAQRIAGIVVHRKTFWKNTHATEPMVRPVIWASLPPVNAELLIGLGVNSADDEDPDQGNMVALSVPTQIGLVSDGADTRVVTVYGLDGDGNPATETFVLDGFNPIWSTSYWTVVWAYWVDEPSARTVSLTPDTGAGSGSIGPNKKISFLWVEAWSRGAGIILPDLAAAQSYGLWRQLTVSAGAPAVRPDTVVIRIEETE